jgi:hypothetical protein
MPQLSSTDRLLMAAKDMTDAFRNPHPDVPFASVGNDTIAALTDLATIFKLKLQQAPSPATQASPATLVQRPSLILSNQILNSPIPPQAAKEITDDNSHSRRPQCAITSEGGHTSDNPSITSEGAHWLPETLTPQPVAR